MSIPDTEVLRPGHFRDKRDGTVAFYCNCGKQPANKTLRYIAANRQHFEHAKPPQAQPTQI